MNIIVLYTVPIFIVGPYDPCGVVDTRDDEYWTRVHPPNIHCVPLYTLSRALYLWR